MASDLDQILGDVQRRILERNGLVQRNLHHIRYFRHNESALRRFEA